MPKTKELNGIVKINPAISILVLKLAPAVRVLRV